MTSTKTPLRFLAWPDWTQQRALDRLVALASPLANRSNVQLVLIRDPVNDPSEITAFQNLQRAFDLRFPPQTLLDVLVSDLSQTPSELAKNCDALLTIGSEAQELIEAVGLPQLDSPVQVIEMLTREGIETRASSEPIASNIGERTASSPVITVIVAAHNRPKKLSQLLAALDRQDLDAEKFEVVICDDGSEESLLAAINVDAHAYALTVLHQENAGPAAARNTAISHARGAVLVFLDDDSIPADGCLSGHLSAQLQATGNTAVMGGFRLTEEYRKSSLAQLIESTSLVYPHPNLSPGKLHNGECLRTTNLSIPTAVIESVGGFDETFNVPGAEDAELAKRLSRALATVVLYEPQIECLHDERPTIDKFAIRQQILGWSTSYMAWRHDDHTLIVGANANAPGPEFWTNLASNLEESIDAVETSLSNLRSQEEKEHEDESPPPLSADFGQRVNRIGFAFFSRGLIDGHTEIQSMVKDRENQNP